ncbi:MAG: glycosyltransferase [Pseudomonadota bacterium]
MICFAALVCTYQGERFLHEQLESLASQSRPLAEVHIHDWGSTDGTRTIARTWAATEGHRCAIQVHTHDEPLGPERSFLSALENLLTHSDASHIFFCDQDDVWFKDRVQRYEALLSSSANAPSLIFSDVSLIDEAGNQLAESFYGQTLSPYKKRVSGKSPDLSLVNPAIGMSMCISRELAEILVTHRGAPWPMHDWAALMLAVLLDLPTAFLADPTAAYRQHSDNLRGSPGIKKLKPRLQRLASRKSQQRALRAWANGCPEPLSTRAGSFFPVSRAACAARVLRSTNLRLWYRLMYALILFFSPELEAAERPPKT